MMDKLINLTNKIPPGYIDFMVTIGNSLTSILYNQLTILAFLTLSIIKWSFKLVFRVFHTLLINPFIIAWNLFELFYKTIVLPIFYFSIVAGVMGIVAGIIVGGFALIIDSFLPTGLDKKRIKDSQANYPKIMNRNENVEGVLIKANELRKRQERRNDGSLEDEMNDLNRLRRMKEYRRLRERMERKREGERKGERRGESKGENESKDYKRIDKIIAQRDNQQKERNNRTRERDIEIEIENEIENQQLKVNHAPTISIHQPIPSNSSEGESSVIITDTEDDRSPSDSLPESLQESSPESPPESPPASPIENEIAFPIKQYKSRKLSSSSAKAQSPLLSFTSPPPSSIISNNTPTPTLTPTRTSQTLSPTYNINQPTKKKPSLSISPTKKVKIINPKSFTNDYLLNQTSSSATLGHYEDEDGYFNTSSYTSPARRYSEGTITEEEENELENQLRPSLERLSSTNSLSQKKWNRVAENVWKDIKTASTVTNKSPISRGSPRTVELAG